MSNSSNHRLHAFNKLVLTLSERSMSGMRTDHEFEIRATRTGAEVWRSSTLHAKGGSCQSGERFVGTLTTRQIIELLDEIERSGIYEALPMVGVVEAASVDPDMPAPLVSMRLENGVREHRLFDEHPADHAVARELSEAVRRRIDMAMERALTWAG